MPVVVSDAGPLIHLAQIDKLYLLEKLFQIVLISNKVKFEAYDEGVRLNRADADKIGKALKQRWIRVVFLPNRLTDRVENMARGENISNADAETLLLAQEKKAILLVDEKVLSKLAKMYGLQVLNTWTILLESLRKNLIVADEVEDAVIELGRKKHKLSDLDAARILSLAKQTVASRKDRNK